MEMLKFEKKYCDRNVDETVKYLISYPPYTFYVKCTLNEKTVWIRKYRSRPLTRFWREDDDEIKRQEKTYEELFFIWNKCLRKVIIGTRWHSWTWKKSTIKES